jgi:hypothetical protein
LNTSKINGNIDVAIRMPTMFQDMKYFHFLPKPGKFDVVFIFNRYQNFF